MKIILLLLVLLVIIGVGVAKSEELLKGNFLPFIKTQAQPQAIINDKTLNLLVVKESKDIEIGLSNRDSLPKDQGMLFIFEKEGIYPFWMRNMKFPIDIIFIKGDKVVKIFDNVKPPQSPDEDIPIYKPESPSDKVLEINAGQAKEFGIKVGDSIQFNNL